MIFFGKKYVSFSTIKGIPYDGVIYYGRINL